MAKSSAQAKQELPRQPLFFKDPWPVDSRRHEKAGIRRNVGFDYTRETNSVPITMHEITEAARSYPIVFTLEETPMPVALLGLKKQNRFVDAKGNWLKGHHVPGYIRKYPFALLELEDKKQFVLCIDEGAPHFQTQNPELALYDGKEAAGVSREALEICRRYQGDYMVTRDFTKALKEAGLLESKEMQAELPNGEKIGIGGFQLISEDKWLAQSDQEFLRWRHNNWVGLAYIIMASQTNWKYLGLLEVG